jgi:hypothetical protein
MSDDWSEYDAAVAREDALAEQYEAMAESRYQFGD